MIRIAYIPREDAALVQGGDYLQIMAVSERLLPLDIQINVTPYDQLNTLNLPDAVYMSQIHHIELTEKVQRWTQANRVFFLISPLFEDEISLSFGAALDGNGKWKRIATLLGTTSAEALYKLWHTSLRTGHSRWRRQQYILQNAYLLPNSQAELSYLTTWFNLRMPHAHIVPLGVDSDIYRSSSQPVTALPVVVQELAGRYILQVGLISQRKNQLGLLSALKDTSYPLVFLGRDSPYEPDYARRLRDAAEARGNVTFINHVDQLTLLALYQHAAVHAMPSWSERPGMVTLEAGACGCRVVATNRSTISDYLGQRAIYCNPVKASSIRAAITSALHGPASQDTATYITDKFSVQHYAQSFYSAVHEILGT